MLAKTLTRRICLIARNNKVGTVKFAKTIANTVECVDKTLLPNRFLGTWCVVKKIELHCCNGDEMHRTKGDVEDANTEFFQLFRLVQWFR